MELKKILLWSVPVVLFFLFLNDDTFSFKIPDKKKSKIAKVKDPESKRIADDPEPDEDEPRELNIINEEYCERYDDSSWSDDAEEFELEIVRLTNRARVSEQDCGEYGFFGPVPELDISPYLTCSARQYIKYLRDRNFMSHTDLEGHGIRYRIEKAGYKTALIVGENLQGQSKGATPEEVVEKWLKSPGHCKTLMNGRYTHIGAGYYRGNSKTAHDSYWSQHFAEKEE